MTNTTRFRFEPLKPWIVCFSAALFFFYEFIQMNMLNSFSDQLMQSFKITGAQLGNLSATYFYSNLIFLLPAGLILDRFSTRKIILISMLISVFGTFLFALTTSFYIAGIARFLSGIGSAFCFLSSIRLASRWFPSHRLALVSGLIITLAMSGGMVAQAPMTYLAELLGWRHAVLIDASLGVFIFALIWSVVQDYPANYQQKEQEQYTQAQSFWKCMGLSYLKWQNWLCGIYTSLMNLPLSILGALWGILYLKQVHDLSSNSAAFITSLIFAGTIIGSPIAGWISDKLSKRRLPMIIGTFISLILVYLLIYVPIHSMLTLSIGFFLLGLCTATQVISYPTVAESNIPALTATSVSVVSFSSIAGYAIFQPLFGWIMDYNWDGATMHHQPIYATSDFHIALSILPISFIVALIAALFISETHCRPQRSEPQQN